ncbi:MAG: 3-methyladenine DNA glycosylase AlkD [Akkermansiaceae bacterium]|jgi:3-methyladenine DNA glycosylase AlkD
MTVMEIMAELESLGSEQTKKTLMRHGALEPLFGVKIGDTKPLQKKNKKNHELALELYETGNSDAMYLAGLIADEEKVTKTQLKQWAKKAPWPLIANSTVAALAAESKHALDLADKWIEAKKDLIAATGWNTYTHHISVAKNEKLDPEKFTDLLTRVIAEIHDQTHEVKAAMNGFVIALGSYLPELTKKAKAAAKKIGTVRVDQGNTACKTPDALAYIEKIEKAGRIGKKRKSTRC